MQTGTGNSHDTPTGGKEKAKPRLTECALGVRVLWTLPHGDPPQVLLCHSAHSCQVAQATCDGP